MGKTYLEPSDTKRMEQAAEYMRDKLLIRLLARLGCRISEALGIAVSDINFGTGTVTIEHLKTRLKLTCPKCEARLSKTSRFCSACGSQVEKAVTRQKEHKRQRTLPVDPDTLAVLKEYVERGGPVAVNGRDLLFGISRTHAWKIVRRCAERAGLGSLVNPETGQLRGISPHRLRDAFAVNAVKRDDSGDGLRLLQEMLGHQSFDTTAKYRKVAGEELKEWYSRLWNKEEDYAGTGKSNHNR